MTFQPYARVFSALLLLIIAGASDNARAQTRSTIIGTIRDGARAALSGVAVTLQNPGVPGQPLTTLTNGRGEYRFPKVSPGMYELTAVLQGWQTLKRTDLRVSVGTTLTVDLLVEKAATPDIVTTSGLVPVVDVTTAASTTKLSTEDLENLPIGGGAGILQLVPGVTPRSAFGSASDTSQLTADGGPITFTARTAAPTVPIHVYWMDEAQVVGLGATAEHGEFSGVVANVALRSGSNRFSGLFEQRQRPSGWVGDNTGSLLEPLQSRFRPQEILSRWGSSAQVGGPIARNRLFFFSGLQYERNKVLQAGTIGDVPLDSRSPAFLTRVTWTPARNLKVDGFVEANQTRSTGTLVRNALPETAGDSTTRMQSWNGRATWTIGPDTLLEFRSGGVKYDLLGIPGAQREGPPPRFDRVTGIRSGNVAMFNDQFGSRFLTGASATRFLEGFGGSSHTLQSGFEIERTTYRDVSGFPGGQSFTDVAGVPGVVMLWAGDSIKGTGTRTTIFLEASWSAGHRLTIQPGVRLSVNRGSVPDKGTVFRTTPVSPRIGVAWDVAADHTTVVRASYARLHEGLFTPLFDFMNTAGRTPRIMARAVGNTFVEINRQTPEGNVAVDDGLAHAYVDQYLIGVEREFFPDFSLTVQYVRRSFDKIWALVDTGSQYAPILGRDPGPDGQNLTADDGPLVSLYTLLNPGGSFTVLTNPDEAFRRYDAVQVIGQKRFSRNWGLLGAYTWSRTRGNINVGGGENRASGTETGSTNGVFFNPNRRINADGPLTFDHPHQLTIQGVYLLPAWGGVGLSAGYSYLSGGAAGRSALITFFPGQTTMLMGQNLRLEPRGTRRPEGASELDARVEKTFPLGRSGRTFGIYADIFNVTNQGIPLALTIVEMSGATFGEPTFWASPRTVQIAARFRF